MTKKFIIFLSKRNIGSSIIAQLFFNQLNRCKEIKAISVGEKIDNKIKKKLIKIMSENELDINEESDIRVDEWKDLSSEIVKKTKCIYTLDPISSINFQINRKNIVNLQIEYPKDPSLKNFRKIRDEIREKVIQIIKKLYLNNGRRCI